jgi:hypothetical protein
MKRRRKPAAPPLPLMLAELWLAPLKTIARRTLLMAQRTCSPPEYTRMVAEKAAAATETAATITRSGGRPSVSVLLEPWHRRATANAKRLRKRR